MAESRLNAIISAFLVVFAFLSECADAVESKSIYIKSESYLQARKNTVNENELPFLEYFEAGYSSGKKIDLDFSLKVLADPLADNSAFDLYSAKLVIEGIADLISVKLGRQTEVGSFSYSLMDGINIALEPDFPVHCEVYSGFKRFVELDDFKDWSFTSGARFFLAKSANTQLALELRYEKLNDSGDWFETGIIAGHTFDTALSPRLKASFNYDFTEKVIDEVSGGAGIKPTENTHLDLDFARYDFKHDILDPAEDIFAIIAIGALWEVKETAGVSLTESVSLFESFAYQNLEYDLIESEPGFEGRIGADLLALKNGLKCSLVLSGSNNYGGFAFNASAKGDYRISEGFSTFARVGYLRFDKVTNEDGNATTFMLGIAWRPLKGLETSLAGEYNSNDQFKRDFRGTLGVRYEFM